MPHDTEVHLIQLESLRLAFVDFSLHMFDLARDFILRVVRERWNPRSFSSFCTVSASHVKMNL